MKKLLIVAVVFCAALVSCGGAKNIKSFTAMDSLSYAAGVQFATNLKMQDSTLNGAILADAWEDVFAGRGKMTLDEAGAFINEWFSVRKPAMDKAEGMAWLEEVKAGNPNIQTTASGLMYEIIKAGDSAVKATSDADQVVVKYRGTYKDGSEFDSHDSIPFPLNSVIPAWTEGMKLVGKGGEIVLWANPDLAYGPRGNMQAMKFEVTLLDVIPAPAEEAVAE